VGVRSLITQHSITLEAGVFDLEGTRRIQESFDMPFNGGPTCPALAAKATAPVTPVTVATSSTVHKESSSAAPETTSSASLKRRLSEAEQTDGESDSQVKTVEASPSKRVKQSDDKKVVTQNFYSFIIDVNIDENKMIKAELCGLHLAEKLIEMGADLLIAEVKAIVHKSD
jgi:hypothetical protein